MPGHTRTPGYLKGRRGVIERFCGLFRNPEELAYGRAGFPEKAVYRVRFPLRSLWPEYAGGPDDTLVADLYEHWIDGGPGRATAGGAGPREMRGVPDAPPAGPSPEVQSAYHRRLEVAVRELLVEKGVLTVEELRRQVADTDGRTALNGATVVARAWRDPAFRARLLFELFRLRRDSTGSGVSGLGNNTRWWCQS